LRFQIEKAGESLISMDWGDDPGEYGPQLAEMDRSFIAQSFDVTLDRCWYPEVLITGNWRRRTSVAK
jgi:hypothetical protein